MAAPVRRVPRAARRSRRSAGDVLAGLSAVVLLAALTVGVPAALVAVLGSPIPHTMPTLSLLTHRLDILATLRILSVVVWLAWLQLIFCVIAEIRAAVRNTGMPARVPLAGGIQPVVHRLVTAALLLFSAATALSPAFAHQAPRVSHSISAAPLPGPGGTGAARAALPAASQHRSGSDVVFAGSGANGDALGTAAQRAPRTERIYVVKPPEGRYHESLWEIAQNHLGDGRRYREIFELNKDRVQPDGSKLTIASLIRPGWVLYMPRDAHGPGIKVVTLHDHPDAPARSGARADHDGARGDHDDGNRTAGPGGAGSGSGQAGSGQAGSGQAGSGQAGSGQAGSGQPGLSQPGLSQPGLQQPAEPGTALRSPSSPSSPSGGPVYPYELAAAALLAAGVLSALGRRRREQLWRRAFGRRVAVPQGQVAGAEVALRLGANEPSARMLDIGLRYLSQALATQGRPLPTVFAAHVGLQNLDLWVAPADRNAPAPWVAVGDGQVWRLPFAVVPGLDPDKVAGASAPYPGLVSIGTDATGRVLVDLESAHGLIAVTGPGHWVQAALAAMAVELATNRWSGPIHITLVGFGADLTALAPGRLSVVSTLTEALPVLEARAELVEESLAATGAGGVLPGRSPGLPPQSWAPHYVISAVPPSASEREQLLTLARTRHAAAAGYVIAGDVAGATWTWEITDQGRLRAGLLGLDVQAQTLPTEQHAAVAELFRTAEQMEGVALGAPPVDAAPAEHLVPGSTMPLEITLLGPVAVRAPGVIEPERLALATEIVVYLATHPGGVHPNVLGAAIWPRGVTREVQDAMLARVGDWLGTDDIGRPHLATDASGRLRLGSQARVDWHVFCALAALAAQAATSGPATPGNRDEEAALSQALGLVNGPFLDGREPGRYAWLASDALEYEVQARVADAGHRLWELLLTDGDPHSAMTAARAALRLAFGDELLWRDLLTAAHATGEEATLRGVIAEICARTALDELLPQMAPETEALIDELLPSWRSSVA